MELEPICLKNCLMNEFVIQHLYNSFGNIFDEGDDELIRDRFLSLRYKGYWKFFITAVLIPAIGFAIAGYVCEIIWLYGVAGSLVFISLSWKLIYQWYIPRAASSFVYSVRNFDTCFNSVITAIREREIISFGLLVNTPGEFHCCNRVLRMELLNSLRGFVRAYMTATENLAVGEEKEKLMHRFFNDSMNDLALSTDVTERILHLSGLKELFKLLTLVRSEYVRLVLFRITETTAYGTLRLCCNLRKFKKKQNRFKKRFTSALKYIFLEEDEVTTKPTAVKPQFSTTEKAVVQLGLALQILKESDSEENIAKVRNILNDTALLIAPKKAKRLRKRKPEKAIVDQEHATPPSEKLLVNGEQVFEGLSEAKEEKSEESKQAFYTKLQKRTPVTRALVSELKGVLGRRTKNKVPHKSNVSFGIELDKSEDNSASSSKQSSLLSSLPMSDDLLLARTPFNANSISAITSSFNIPLNPGLLEAIRSRSNLPATNYGDTDEN